MESNRVIAGTIGLFIVICLVGAVLAPMINDWATGERITNEGAGWLRMDYTEVTESSNYSMAVSIAGGTITVTDTNSATQSGADDTIAYASSTLAIWTDSGTIQILGTDPDGDPYYATASSSVNVWYSLVLGQIIKIDGSEDAITFATPTWAYLPLTNGNYAFFDNGTSVQTEEGKPFVAVGGGFAGEFAYNNLMPIDIGMELQTTQDADGLINGAYWAVPDAQQDQRSLNPITLDPRDPDTRTDDPDSSTRSVPTPTYTDGDWGYDRQSVGGVQKAIIVSYSGAGGGAITIPSTVGGYEVFKLGRGNNYYNVFPTTLTATDLIIPDGVTTIGDYAVNGCTGFTGDLVIPSSVTAIGAYAFKNTKFTGTLDIPSSVTTIGDSAFYGCTGFTGDLVIPSSVTTIGGIAFRGCTGFTGKLVLSSSVTTLGADTFRGCTGFTGDLIIPDGVTIIGSGPFYGCTGFTGSLVIPSSVTTIGGSAFRGVDNIKNVIIQSDATPSNADSLMMNGVTSILDLSDAIDYSTNRYGLPAGATVQDNIGDALGYISFVEKGSDPLVPAGAAAVMLAIPVVILGALIVVAATTFIRKE